MGNSLNNTTPANTYPALIKVGDNTSVDATLQALSDGNGNDLPMEVSSSTVNFTNTVTGLPVPATGHIYRYTIVVATTSGTKSGITSATAPSGLNLIGAVGWTITLTGDNVIVTHPLGNTIFWGQVRGVGATDSLIRPYTTVSSSLNLAMHSNSTYTVLTFYGNTVTNTRYNNSATNPNALTINFFSSVYL
jgi:hypothetical protein